MKLEVGQIAPDFTAIDINGNSVRLSDFKGKKIILGFFRNVNCPFCNRRVHQLIIKSLSFNQKDVQLLFLFESSTEVLTKSTFHQGISPWPLIGDSERNVYKQYGVDNSVWGYVKSAIVADLRGALKETKEFNLPKDNKATQTLMPADFFIDENFKIAKAHYGNHLDDHVDYEELISFAGINDPFKNLKRNVG